VIFAAVMKNTLPEYELVRNCLFQIEEKLGWGNSGEWHSEVFEELSEAIQQETQVLLSATTLKRVWGKVNYDSAPSITTLNALSQFAGYANWRDFKQVSIASKPIKEKRKGWPKRSIALLLVFLAVTFLVSIYTLIDSEASPEKKKTIQRDYSQVTFSSQPIAEGIPNSVVFDFNLNGIESDSIYIQQFWDRTKTIKLSAAQDQATGIYYFPGYFRSKLLVDGEIIKEHDLFIKSNHWLGTIDYEPVPKYISSEKVFKDTLSLPKAILDEVKASGSPLVSSFHLVDDFGDASADNFLLETTFRNVYQEKWAVCQNTKIVILGTKGAMIIPFSIPGCVSDLGLLLNDVFYNGKRHDLSAFGIDQTEYRAISIHVHDKQIKVLVDGNEIYAGSYNESAGRFVGIRYRFVGAGEVSHLTVSDTTGRTVFKGF
jgi:hypothetical protein